jgi:hypothetical protein
VRGGLPLLAETHLHVRDCDASREVREVVVVLKVLAEIADTVRSVPFGTTPLELAGAVVEVYEH